MQSKNKPRPTKLEQKHLDKLSVMSCVVCGSRPVEIHELKQGQWYTSIPICASCHRCEHNGIHGQKVMWKLYRMDELDALNRTIKLLMEE